MGFGNFRSHDGVNDERGVSLPTRGGLELGEVPKSPLSAGGKRRIVGTSPGGSSSMLASASVWENDTGGGQHRQSEGKQQQQQQQPWTALGNAGKRERGGSAVVTGSPLATMKKTWRSTSDYALDISASASPDSLDSLDSLEVQIGAETYELGEIEFWLEVRVQERYSCTVGLSVCRCV